MRGKEWEAKLAHLLSMGASKGFLTYQDLSDQLEGTEASPEVVEGVLAVLEAAGIAVVQHEEQVAEVDVVEEPTGETAFPDAFSAYQMQLGRIAPLSEDEEVALAGTLREAFESLRRVRAALEVSAAETGKDSVESLYQWATNLLATRSQVAPAEHADLLAQVESSLKTVDSVRHRMVEGCMRLVVHLAGHYRDRGVDFLDLVQEGNAGLLRAAQHFDPYRGHPFSSYATSWIRQALSHAIRVQSKSFKVPEALDDEIKRVNQARRRLEQRFQREPTPGEIAQELGVDEERVEQLLTLISTPLRLDEPVREDARESLEGVLQISVGPQQLVDDISPLLREEIERVVGTLEPVEQEVIRLRHGLADGIPRPPDEVAKLMGISRERVRRLEERALRKLRHPSRRARLETE